jgi:hypothetical protein
VRAKILSHANTTLGKIPYGVLLGKMCYAAAPRKMPCIPESKCFNQMLELAKGFEPPTL